MHLLVMASFKLCMNLLSMKINVFSIQSYRISYILTFKLFVRRIYLFAFYTSMFEEFAEWQKEINTENLIDIH